MIRVLFGVERDPSTQHHRARLSLDGAYHTITVASQDVAIAGQPLTLLPNNDNVLGLLHHDAWLLRKVYHAIVDAGDATNPDLPVTLDN